MSNTTQNELRQEYRARINRMESVIQDSVDLRVMLYQDPNELLQNPAFIEQLRTYVD